MQEGLKHLKALATGGSGGASGGGASSSGAAAGGAGAGAAASGPIVFCVGGPGAGKTTVCRMLEEKYKASYYAAGDPHPHSHPNPGPSPDPSQSPGLSPTPDLTAALTLTKP